MLGRRAYQGDLFDVSPRIAFKIDPDSIFALIHKLGPLLLRDEDFAPMYAEGQGRPSHPPSLLAGILLLQRHADVSDREAIERLRFDLRWQYALRLPVDYNGFSHANLVHFRSRLIVHGLEGQVFDRFLELAQKAEIVGPEEAQAIDSSHVFGAAAVQDTYELLRQSLRGLLEVLLEEDPSAAEGLIQSYDLEERLASEKPDIDWTSKEARQQWLGAVVRDARALLGALDNRPLAAAPAVQEAAQLLSQILAQDITPSGQEPAITRGVATDRIISTVDPEMRHGRKSSARRFDGYKVHITEALKSELITGVAVTAGNSHDGAAAGPLVKDVTERMGSPPETLIGDSHYGSLDCRVALEEAGVEVIAKLPPAAHGTRSQFGKDRFEIDLENEQVTCPAGETTERSSLRKGPKGRPTKVFRFSADQCQPCALREQCTTAKKGRSIRLHYHEETLQETRAYNQTEEFDQRYNRRALVERKLSELLWRHGLRYGRYFGRKKTEFQALWTAAMVNIKRAGADLLDELTPEAGLTPEPA
jgi:transposase